MPVCGDGLKVGNEVCDDGVLVGCLGDCSGPRANFTCTPGSSSSPSVCSCNAGFHVSGSVCLPTCGDGLVVGNEVCDDTAQGGCLSDCSAAHSNYTCTSGSPSSPSVCSCKTGFSGASCNPVCGDGKLVGNEVCDDTNSGGCTANCLAVNSNYTCSGGSPTTATVCSCLPGFQTSGMLCLNICGDGKLYGIEGCDDGGQGGCMADCSAANNNFTCSGGTSSVPSTCSC